MDTWHVLEGEGRLVVVGWIRGMWRLGEGG